MNQKTEKRKSGIFKTLLIAAIMVATVTGAFYGTTQVAAAAENNKVTTLPTAYPISVSTPATPEQAQAPEGYVKPAYTIVDNSLEYYRDKKPTANDISKEEAAEVGVQALWSVFGLDLNGKTIEMGYEPAQDMVRAKWSGEYWIDGQSGPDHPMYRFTVDAITGEIYGVGFGRILNVNANLGYDAELSKNPAAAEAIAKKYAEELNAVGGPVKSSTIGSQGYSGNDPVVNFRIVGENGRLAVIQISRYDNALLSIAYHDYVIEEDAVIKQIEREAAEMQAEIERRGAETGNTGTPQMIPFSN